ncbi:MAG: IS1634 family transposase [Ardenticatenia bacterium]|nr:IS1634 family transposase [Ardenticatenia bacterium]
MDKVIYRTERLDHLGIVAGICHEINLIGHIDRLVPAPKRQVSVGEAVQAMVLNALGFVGRPLYLMPEWFANKPVELLIRPGITAAMLNDDSLGRALDALWEAGLTQVFAHVATQGLEHFGLLSRFVHVDTRSFHVHGVYEGHPEKEEVIRITRGYSRDHRPDLKQVVVGLLTTYRAALPLWIQALDGNAADVKSLPQLVQAYVTQLREGEEPPYIIADSALYSKENLHTLSTVKWITRVPERIAGVREVEAAMDVADMQPSALEGYRYAELGGLYGGVRQRWLVVYSQAAYERDVKALEKRIAKERAAAEQAMQRLGRQAFATSEEAKKAVAQTRRRWKYHTVQVRYTAVPHYGRRGRPRKETPPEHIGWRIKAWEVKPDEAAHEAVRRRAGKFVLATNELDETALPAEEILVAYKGQGVGPERGFRFLKDPWFFADSLFLKSPQRIMALVMVMGLALLVYALAEHKRRQRLQETRGEHPQSSGQADPASDPAPHLSDI